MVRAQSHAPKFTAIVLGCCILATLFAVTASAYLFGPGKYCGVVVFDRWGTCYLVSGPYINYVASNVKSELLPYKGRAIQVDATKVTGGGLQLNDPMIHEYKILGPAPAPKWVQLNGLQLVAIRAFGRYTRPQFLIEIRNNGKSPVKVDRSKIGILLFKAEKQELSSSDDDSVALISRSGIEDVSYITHAETGNQKMSWGYIVDMETRPPANFVIQPGESVRTRVRFKLYPGQFQFMFGYGGDVSSEKSLVSNAISFDIAADGLAVLRK
jgi:hypothetical protein